MPIYRVDYAFQVQCYGSTEVEADSPDQAEKVIKELYSKGSLINGWDPDGSTADNYRVIHVIDDSGKPVLGEIDLDEEPTGRIEDGDCVMTVEEFRQSCENGMFIDYDGFGYAAFGDQVGAPVDESVQIRPSKRDEIRPDATHVVWFNK